MKKLIDLYRQYGISPGRLRDLALEMEKIGRAQKRRDVTNSWQEGGGKEVWYLEEAAVLEYLSGQHHHNEAKKKNDTAQKLADLTIELEDVQAREQSLLQQVHEAQAREQALQQQVHEAQTQIQFAQQKLTQSSLYAQGWKQYAKILHRHIRTIHPNYAAMLYAASNVPKKDIVSWEDTGLASPPVDFFPVPPSLDDTLQQPIASASPAVLSSTLPLADASLPTTIDSISLSSSLSPLSSPPIDLPDIDILAWKKLWQQIKDGLTNSWKNSKVAAAFVSKNAHSLCNWFKTLWLRPYLALHQSRIWLGMVICQIFWALGIVLVWLFIHTIHFTIRLCQSIRCFTIFISRCIVQVLWATMQLFLSLFLWFVYGSYKIFRKLLRYIDKLLAAIPIYNSWFSRKRI